MKKEQRKPALERRRALSVQQRSEYSRIICRELLKLEEIRNARKVFSYLAAWDEVDLSLLYDWLYEKNVQLAFPLSLNGGQMEARIPNSPVDIEEGKFKIKAPMADKSEFMSPEEFDVVILPCVGFDGDRNRLGHGGGYYDRYLPRCSNARFICVAFEAQRLEKVFAVEHDIKPDIIITEKTLIR